MKDVKMIVSDLDGTLFNSDEENYQVSPQIITLIDYLHEHGVLFTIATGRPQYSCKTVVEALKLKIPYIAYNGAMILDAEGKVYDNNTFSIALWKSFLQKIDHLGGTILFYFNGGIYYYRYTSAVGIYEKKEQISCTPFNHDYLDQEVHVNKILLIGDNKLYRQEWEETLPYEMRKNHQYVISEHNYLEILKKGVSKGSALKRLKRQLNIPDDGVIGIGNQMNDKELLEESYLGVAVENAEEELKRSADQVTKEPYERGVLEVLEAVAETYMENDRQYKIMVR